MKSAAWDGDWRITQGFGENKEYYNNLFGLWGGHNGIDVGCPIGTALRAVERSYVLEVSTDPLGYGLTVYLLGDSGKGYRYGHGSAIRVRQGDTISAGTVIMLSGNSGNSSGPHLHFGIRPYQPNAGNGTSGYVDPMPYLVPPAPVSPSQEDDEMALSEQEKAALEKLRALSWGAESIDLAISKIGRAAEVGRTLRDAKSLPAKRRKALGVELAAYA